MSTGSNTKITFTQCNICVAGCGLAVTTENNKVIDIKPDKDNYFWRDFCIKGAESYRLLDHPSRITKPMKRVGDRYVEVSYKQMLSELSNQLNTIIDTHGANAVGSYIGNPGTSNFGVYAFLGLMMDAIGSNNRYFVGSIDQNGMHIVNELMFNHPWAFLQPDVDNCQYLMMLGANPAVSEFGWLYSVNNGWKRALKAKKNGSTLVLIDPKKTESAKKASLHLAPLPDTDWAFLLGLIHTILSNDWHNKEALHDLNDFEPLRKTILAIDIDALSQRCDIPLATIQHVARDFSHAPSAICVANTGVGQSSTGTVGLWLANVLTLITGNMRRKGGIFHTKGAMNLLKTGAELFPAVHFKSRVRGTDAVAGYLPVTEIPDEINTAGEGQLKAFFMVAGNPVISGPEGEVLDQALEKLDLLIAVDNFQRESHRHADWLIPGSHFLEIDELPLLLRDLNAKPAAQMIRKAVDHPENAHYEWEFFRDLTLAMGRPLLLGKKPLNYVVKLMGLIPRFTGNRYDGFSPKTLAKAVLKKGRATTYKAIDATEHGLLLDETIDEHYFLDNLPTSNGKVNLAPKLLFSRLETLLNTPIHRDNQNDYPFLLINRRRKHMMNSWLSEGAMQKMKLREADTVEINSDDAQAAAINDGDTVEVRSSVGTVNATAKVSSDVRPSVVVMAHGWGGRTFNPNKAAEPAQVEGVNRNLLVSNAKSETDPLSGIPKLNGTPVSIKRRKSASS